MRCPKAERRASQKARIPARKPSFRAPVAAAISPGHGGKRAFGLTGPGPGAQKCLILIDLRDSADQAGACTGINRADAVRNGKVPCLCCANPAGQGGPGHTSMGKAHRGGRAFCGYASRCPLVRGHPRASGTAGGGEPGCPASPMAVPGRGMSGRGRVLRVKQRGSAWPVSGCNAKRAVTEFAGASGVVSRRGTCTQGGPLTLPEGAMPFGIRNRKRVTAPLLSGPAAR